MASKALAKEGVELITGTTISSIQAAGGKVSGVTLKNKEKRPCGLVIMAIGVIPETSLVDAKQVMLDRGIMVDERCMTTAQGVYAAGDVAQAMEILSGERRSIPIWPNAFRQGYIAGINMAGGSASYEGGLAMNAVEICGLPTVSAGLTTVSGR
jgi:nitrite reductase (NADH) large subunit